MRANLSTVPGILLLSVTSVVGVAADPPNTINVDSVHCWGGPVDITNTPFPHGSFKAIGTVRTSPPGGPNDDSSSICYGTFALVAAGVWESSGYCDFADKDGDHYFGRWSRKGNDPGTWEMISGTGKFERLTGRGQWTPVGSFPALPGYSQGCARSTGAYVRR